MKRTMIVGAAALLFAGVAYPLLALDSSKHSEPASVVEKKDASKATEVQPSELIAKDTTVTTPAVTETTEGQPSELIAKDTTTTPPAATETKPAAATPSATDTVTDGAKNVVKEKVADVAKDKAMDAANSVPTTPNVPAPVAK